MRCVGLFAGVGGIELGLSQSGIEAEMLCEISPSARSVLAARFPSARIETDIRQFNELPEVEIVTAGFPCQDLSQAGQTKGIGGLNSGLVNEMFRLIAASKKKPTWLLFENVPFMLALQNGRAMRHLVSSLEAMGYRWAYRVVDARSFGVPQRRRRVVLLASLTERPEDVLLTDDAGECLPSASRRTARGFYWTEGRSGLGWAVGAIPTLKGGSSIGIPSPPAIWFPARRSLELPGLRDAERLQGFRPDWTAPAENGTRASRNARWKLIGNAVCVPMMEWVGHRLKAPGRYVDRRDPAWNRGGAWPNAAWGSNGRVHISDVSTWPCAVAPPTLSEFLKHDTAPLSARATKGFLSRARSSNLTFEDGFLEDVEHHLATAEAVA